jgi:hypothetical protein
MKQAWKVCVGAVGAALLGSGAIAVEESRFLVDDAADLAALCGASPSDPNYAAAIQMCQGYMLGVHHFHTAWAQQTNEDIYCLPAPPDAPSRNAIMAGFSVWAAETPGAGDMEALTGLMTWASQTFPCE